MSPIERLMAGVSTGALAWDLGAVLGCLAIAYALCWLMGRQQPKDSIWFGRALVDGVLFPLLALGLVYVARIVLGNYQNVPLLRIAVPMLVALAGIRLLARVLTVVFPTSGLARAAERVFSWVAWIAAVLWILGLLPAVKAEMQGIQFAFGKSSISLLELVQGVLSLGIVLVVALWVSAMVERKLLRQNIHDLSLRKVASNITRALLLLVGFLFALSAVGVDLTALSVLGGAIGVGLGFGLQKLASNYVSGFVILFERSLRIGDTVRVDGFEGVVADIKTRYTLIRAGNGRESIVPNEKLITERIENLSLDDPKLLVTIDIGIGYDSDVDLAQQLLLEAALAQEAVLRDPQPVCRMQRFGTDALEFQLLFWVGSPAAQAKTRSDTSLAILRSLRAAGIDIPYPQRVVRVEGPVAIASTTATTG